MHRWDIINLFIQKKNYKSYLEIGYFKGWSFDNVKCQNKWAVDPNPCKFPEQESWPYGVTGVINKMTSDDYFAMQTEGVTYDIIFIDGLHEATQVTRDIENALKHLSPKGTIILHDCNPPTLAHATTGDHAGNWNGDVYKAFIKWRFQNPEYETYTIDTDWGCGVITTNQIDSTWKEKFDKGTISETEWELFDRKRKEMLNLISVEEFIKKNHEETKDHNMSA